MITFIKTERKQQISILPQHHLGPISTLMTYHTYTGFSKQEALDFLSSLNNIPKYTYYCVETPDGIWCKDILGVYTEKRTANTSVLDVPNQAGSKFPKNERDTK